MTQWHSTVIPMKKNWAKFFSYRLSIRVNKQTGLKIIKLEDLKCSPDLLNYVKVILGLSLKHILFYNMWGLQWPKIIKRILHIWILSSNSPVISECIRQSNWVALDERSQVSLTFGTYIKPLSIRLNISHKYHDISLKSFRKMNISILFSYKCFKNQIWPCRKVGQCQPIIIICAN